MFNPFKGKNKEKAAKSEEEKYFIQTLYSDNDAEKGLIIYILLKSKTNDISLAQKDGNTYINFRGEKIQGFLKDWYNILTLRQHNRISENIYQMFISSQLEDEKLTGKPSVPKEEPDNEFDDFFDIFSENKI